MAKYGFLGLGIMGSAMAANLVRDGHDVTVWNRTADKIAPLLNIGAKGGANPAEVVAASQLTFAMVSDPAASRELCFGDDGVLTAVGPCHDYVEMSTIDDATAVEISQAVTSRGGRFLEAPVSGTKKPAEDGQLIIMAAGHRDLFDDAEPAFSAMGKMAVYLGDVGEGAKMKLVINAIMAGAMTALAEGVALAEKSGLELAVLLDLLDAGVVSSPLLRAKGPQLISREYPASFPLKHMQKDLRLALALADRVDQPLAVTAAINQAFIKARIDGHGDEDFSAVLEAISEKS